MHGGYHRFGLFAFSSALIAAVLVLTGMRSPAQALTSHAIRSPAPECSVSGTIADGKAESGQAIYNRRCKACHGELADGKGKLAKKQTKQPSPWNTKAAWDKTTDTFKFQSTKCGGKAVGKSEDMPDYPELTDQQIWDVLAYAKTLRSPEK